jgi:ketosteroid isomerase-like protein
MVECLHCDYDSVQPCHPARAFKGAEQVHQNWTAAFATVPDLTVELVRCAREEGDAIWCEWWWRGTRTDGRSFEMRGVTLFGIEDDRIAWGRLYMEDVEGSATA